MRPGPWPACAVTVAVAAALSLSGCHRPATTAFAFGQPARHGAAFTGLAFASQTSGWLLGSAGPQALIWHTATGGASWEVQWRGPGRPLAISAADPRHAWALIACPGTVRPCGRALLATSDGGRTWRLAARLPAEVSQVQFATPDLGVATANPACPYSVDAAHCPGTLLVSRDGGRAWRRALASRSLVFAVAAADGPLWAAEVATGPRDRYGRPGSAVRFLASADDGETWRPAGFATYRYVLSAQLVMQLAAGPAGLDLASIWDPASCAMHGCSTANLLRSPDGGHHWADVPLPESGQTPCGPVTLTFSASGAVPAWVVTGFNPGACFAPYTRLYREAGSTLRQVPPSRLPQIGVIEAVSDQVAYALAGANGNGSFDAVVRSIDGGRTWQGR